ncbi:MAG: 2-oxo acid dehydrogenase subunit E2 [Bacteroidetes bacterium]|nr:2-oxo acid dehydrogenase subunit E2 [Bacteroidota bacterium]
MVNKINYNTPWRKTAATIYKKSVDSKLFGSVEIDVTELEKYIESKRQVGLKVTLTHIVFLATARAVKEIPQLNTYVKRGNICSHKSIDGSISVLLAEGEMSSIKICNADVLSLNEIVTIAKENINKARKGSENQTMKLKSLITYIPWPISKWISLLIKNLITNWGLSIKSLGLSANTFGSFFLTNIGSVGLDVGYPALMPYANVSFVLVMGGCSLKPWIVNGEIMPRKILNLSAALDHRVVDASHGGKLFKQLKHYLNNPELLEK